MTPWHSWMSARLFPFEFFWSHFSLQTCVQGKRQFSLSSCQKWVFSSKSFFVELKGSFRLLAVCISTWAWRSDKIRHKIIISCVKEWCLSWTLSVTELQVCVWQMGMSYHIHTKCWSHSRSDDAAFLLDSHKIYLCDTFPRGCAGISHVLQSGNEVFININ